MCVPLACRPRPIGSPPSGMEVLHKAVGGTARVRRLRQGLRHRGLPRAPGPDELLEARRTATCGTGPTSSVPVRAGPTRTVGAAGRYAAAGRGRGVALQRQHLGRQSVGRVAAAEPARWSSVVGRREHLPDRAGPERGPRHDRPSAAPPDTAAPGGSVGGTGPADRLGRSTAGSTAPTGAGAVPTTLPGASTTTRRTGGAAASKKAPSAAGVAAPRILTTQRPRAHGGQERGIEPCLPDDPRCPARARARRRRRLPVEAPTPSALITRNGGASGAARRVLPR